MDHQDHPKVARARMALCTLNNPKVDTREYLEAWSKLKDVVYVTGQLEKGENGTPHIQYFVQTKEKHRPQFYKDHCKHSHFELVTNNNGADQYCMKEDTRLEGPFTFGIKPAKRNVKGDLARRNADIIEYGAEKAVIDGLIHIKDFPKVKIARDEFLNDTVIPEELEGDLKQYNFWIYGPAGAGKTRHVLDNYEVKDVYWKNKKSFWNGYTNQSVVCLDDVEKHEHFQIANLKEWAQHKPFKLENKYGGLRNIRPKHIIVTSNYHYKDICQDDEDIAAIERRFTVIHKYEPYIFKKKGVL